MPHFIEDLNHIRRSDDVSAETSRSSEGRMLQRFRGNAHRYIVGDCVGRMPKQRPARSRSTGTSHLPVALSPLLERLANLDLWPARRRHIVTPVRHVIGEVALARGVAARFVMGIPIALTVADFLHQAAGRLAQMQRYLERAQTGGVLGCRLVRGI